MTPDTCRQFLTDGNWRALFIDELGWNGFSSRIEVALFKPGQHTPGWPSVEERARRDKMIRLPFALQGVAEKCGMAIFICPPHKRGQIPDYTMRCEIERRLRKSNHHHLIVFTNGTNATQIWQWSQVLEDGDREYCEHTFQCFQEDEGLLHRLSCIAFSFVEEETLTLVDVLQRVQSAFYFTRTKAATWRLRLHNHDLSEYSEVVQAWTKQAYTERGLSRKEERQLARAAKAGNKTAKARLVATHLYIPLETAWKLKHKRGLAGIELEDLIHEGYFGLWRAAKNFGPEKEQRFQAHAAYWVRNRMERAILHWSRLIAVPLYVEWEFQPVVQQYALVEDHLTQRLERNPTREEMAEKLGLQYEQMFVLDMVRNEVLSLETLLEQEEFSAEDNLACTPVASTSDIEKRVMDADALETILSGLRIRERYVVMSRFGLFENEELTLEEIGAKLHITRERVRQIEAGAIRRLKSHLLDEPILRRGRPKKVTSETPMGAVDSDE